MTMSQILKRAVALGIGSLFLCAPANAEWLPVGTSTQGSVWMMDYARIRTVGNIRHVWVKIDHSKDATVTYRSSMTLFGINCDGQSFKLLGSTNYDSYNKVVESYTPSSPTSTYDYKPIIPETMVETVAKFACPDV